MKNFYTLDYGLMYRLFGFKRPKIDIAKAIKVLLQCIAPINWDHYHDLSTSQLTSMSSLSMGLTCLDIKKAKQMLPNYLGTSRNDFKLLRVETKLRTIDQKTTEFNNIPWWRSLKMFRLYKELRILKQERLEPLTAFQFLECKASKMGISSKDLLKYA